MRFVCARFFTFFLTVFPLFARTHHRVETGQTLYRIAQKYGISVSTLMDINGIRNPRLVLVGMLLFIPRRDQLLRESGRIQGNDVKRYQVAHGDTYYSIARRHGVDLDDLLDVNGRSRKVLLRAGEFLILPRDRQGSPTYEGFSSVSSSHNFSKTALPNLKRLQSDPLTWPVLGRVVKNTGKQGGVRIQLSTQQDVRAVASGTVVYYGRYRELGPIILVEHRGGYIYIYAGVAEGSSSFKVGDRVYHGDIIGRSVPGRDIVFSVFKDANPIDPKNAPRA